MAAIIRVRDENGNVIDIPAIVGDPGEKGDPVRMVQTEKTATLRSVVLTTGQKQAGQKSSPMWTMPFQIWSACM